MTIVMSKQLDEVGHANLTKRALAVDDVDDADVLQFRLDVSSAYWSSYKKKAFQLQTR